MNEVLILVGAPGSGKTWVSDQLKDIFDVVEHDNYKSGYCYVLAKRALGEKPVLGNTPFGLSDIMKSLLMHGVKCIPVFVIESDHVVSERYEKREGRAIPQGHITRQQSYIARAKELNAFKGTSTQVLEHLHQYIRNKVT
jgi:hypothetical protein